MLILLNFEYRPIEHKLCQAGMSWDNLGPVEQSFLLVVYIMVLVIILYSICHIYVMYNICFNAMVLVWFMTCVLLVYITQSPIVELGGLINPVMNKILKIEFCIL